MLASSSTTATLSTGYLTRHPTTCFVFLAGSTRIFVVGFPLLRLLRWNGDGWSAYCLINCVTPRTSHQQNEIKPKRTILSGAAVQNSRRWLETIKNKTSRIHKIKLKKDTRRVFIIGPYHDYHILSVWPWPWRRWRGRSWSRFPPWRTPSSISVVVNG